MLTFPPELELIDPSDGIQGPAGTLTWVFPAGLASGQNLVRTLGFRARSGTEGVLAQLLLRADSQDSSTGIPLAPALDQDQVQVAWPDLFEVSKNVFSSPDRVDISLASASGGSAVLLIYNSAGELVLRLGSWESLPGLKTTFSWDGRNQHGDNVASGIYLIRAEMKHFAASRRVAVLR